MPSGGQPEARSKPSCSVTKGIYLITELPPCREMPVGSNLLPTFSLRPPFLICKAGTTRPG